MSLALNASVKHVLEYCERRGRSDGPAIVSALRNLGRGTATPGQQVMAVTFLALDLCGFFEVADRDAGEREVGVLDGRRDVGAFLFRMADLRITAAGTEAQPDAV